MQVWKRTCVFFAIIAVIYNISSHKQNIRREGNKHSSFENEIHCDKSEPLLGVISRDRPQEECTRNGSEQKNEIEKIAHVAIEQGSTVTYVYRIDRSFVSSLKRGHRTQSMSNKSLALS